MFLQRLIADKDIGFNYDYMGYAEYEFGATPNSRTRLAELYLQNNLASIGVTMVEQFGRSNSKPFDVVVIASKDDIAYINHQRDKDAQKRWYVTVDKTSMRSDNAKIIGWMSVRIPKPIFIIRQDLKDRGPQFEAFMTPFVEELTIDDINDYLDDEPNPNNSDGLSNAQLRERLNRETMGGLL